MSILVAILGFSLLVFVHELGHFLLARLTGMKVEKFSIGFGPALYSFGKETVYQIALLPFGGFVQIKGLMPKQLEEEQSKSSNLGKKMSDLEQEWFSQHQSFSPVGDFPDQNAQESAPLPSDQNPPPEPPDPDSYQAKPVWARFLVVFAGPFFNFVFTLFVFWFLFYQHDALSSQSLRLPTLVMKEVSGAAKDAGMRAGDVILEIDGDPIKTFWQVRQKTRQGEGKPMLFKVARPPQSDQKLATLSSLPTQLEDFGYHAQSHNLETLCLKLLEQKKLKEGDSCKGLKGLTQTEYRPQENWPTLTLKIQPKEIRPHHFQVGVLPEMARYGGEGVWSSLGLAWKESRYILEQMAHKISAGFKGEEEVEVASVVKITAMSADSFNRGHDWFLNFLALLSLNLAFLNLLPFPALDGGRLIFLGIEVISRRPVSPQIEMVVHGLGILFLIALTLWITAQDILSLM